MVNAARHAGWPGPGGRSAEAGSQQCHFPSLPWAHWPHACKAPGRHRPQAAEHCAGDVCAVAHASLLWRRGSVGLPWCCDDWGDHALEDSLTGLLAHRGLDQVVREAVGPEGRVMPQQWLAKTTAPPASSFTWQPREARPRRSGACFGSDDPGPAQAGRDATLLWYCAHRGVEGGSSPGRHRDHVKVVQESDESVVGMERDRCPGAKCAGARASPCSQPSPWGTSWQRPKMSVPNTRLCHWGDRLEHSLPGPQQLGP